MLNVAVIGAGHWGPNLIRNMSALASVRLHAICDRDRERAERVAGRFCRDAKIVTSVAEVHGDPAVDAVLIATPIASHFALAEAFLRSGRHVLVEKPLAETADQCRTLMDIAEAKNLCLMVGHTFLFNKAVHMVKDYVTSGEIGRVLYIHGQRVNLGRVQNDRNALWSFGPHDISILNYWLDADPVTVSATGFRCLAQAVEDVVFMTLEYPGGVGVNLNLSWLNPHKVRMMTVVGSEKMIVYDDVSTDSKVQIHDKGISNLNDFLASASSFSEFQFKIRSGDVTYPALKFSEPLAEECQHFVNCIETGERPFTDGANGLRVVSVLEAAQRSLDAGDGRRLELQCAV